MPTDPGPLQLTLTLTAEAVTARNVYETAVVG
jgi:hypothetical protein